jgi:CxxC motif-containing protein (DUF1111 family)
MTVQRSGESYKGTFQPSPEGGIRHTRGESAHNAAATRQFVGGRVSLNLLGDGYIEAIDSRHIERNAEEQQHAKSGIKGSVVRAPALESNSTSLVMQAGRFGWKSQHSSLMSSCADSLRNELGIRNTLYTDEYPTHLSSDGPTPVDSPDPKTGKTELGRLVEEIRRTAPPARDSSLAASLDSAAGEKLFSEVGCALCHVPTYRTLPAGTRINGGTYRIPKFLGGKIIHPYSDFLLHDLGTGDGIPQSAKPEFLDQSTANKFRTPPLWGLRFRATHLMHDGDTASPEAAIKRHAGEATKVRDRYNQLPPEKKQQVLTFLNSL